MSLKEKMLKYDFTITYTPGNSKTIRAADALSCYSTAGIEDITDHDDQPSNAFAAQQAGGIDSVTWVKVKEAASTDKSDLPLLLH